MFTLIIEDIHGGTTHQHRFEECELVIGRSHDKCDIVLPSDNVSRRHAKVYTSGGRCFVQDLGSANGVQVDGRRIRDVAEVGRANRIRIGDYILHVEPDERGPAAGGQRYGRLVGTALAGGLTFDISQPVYLVGRGKDTAITVIDASVSRVHARITVGPSGELVAQDLRSSNGTFVNDERIEQRVLRNGDRLRFGNIEFVVETAAPAAAPYVAMPPPMAPPVLPVAPYAAPAAYAPAPPMPQPVMMVAPAQAGYAAVAEDDENFEIVTNSGRKVVFLIVLGLLLVAGLVVTLVLVARSDSGSPAAAAGGPGVPDPLAAQKKAEEEREKRRRELDAENKLREGRELISKRRWDSAHETLRQALQLDPANEDAFRLLDQIARERGFASRMVEADALLLERKYDKAIRIYDSIPGKSVYRPDATTRMTELRNETLPKLLLEADEACNKKVWDECVTHLREALTIDPTNADVSTRLRRLEKRNE